MSKEPKVGLALGGGAARGWAHLGAIRAVEEAGTEVSYVAGTSIGALVGCVYASGNIKGLEQIAADFDFKQILYLLDIVFPRSGLIDGKKIAAFVGELIGERRIEDLDIPFSAVATDIRSGTDVVINTGSAIEAVRASISLPGIFTPLRMGDAILADGGITNPVPVDVVRAMGADFVIAVDLNCSSDNSKGLERISNRERIKPEKGSDEGSAVESGKARSREKISKLLGEKYGESEEKNLGQIRKWFAGENDLPSIFDVLMAAVNIMESAITEARLKEAPPDMLIRPELGHINLLEFNKAEEAKELGYKEAKRCIEEARLNE